MIFGNSCMCKMILICKKAALSRKFFHDQTYNETTILMMHAILKCLKTPKLNGQNSSQLNLIKFLVNLDNESLDEFIH